MRCSRASNRVFSYVARALLFAALACGDNGPSQPGRPLEIRGQVFNSDSVPVVATVTLFNGGGAFGSTSLITTVATNSEGQYVIAHPVAHCGFLWLRASAAGYEPLESRSLREADLQCVSTPQELNFYLSTTPSSSSR